VCEWLEDDKLRNAYVESLSMIDVSPLWITGFSDLPGRLEVLGERLANKK
jgi:hypothetical protein